MTRRKLFDVEIVVRAGEVEWPLEQDGEVDVFMNGVLMKKTRDYFAFAGKLHWRNGPALKGGDRLGLRYRRAEA